MRMDTLLEPAYEIHTPNRVCGIETMPTFTAFHVRRGALMSVELDRAEVISRTRLPVLSSPPGFRNSGGGSATARKIG